MFLRQYLDCMCIEEQRKYINPVNGFYFLFNFVSKFSPLAEGFGYFRLEIRILRKKLYILTGGQVWKPKIWWKKRQKLIFKKFFV